VLDLTEYIRDNGRCTCKGYAKGKNLKCMCNRYDTDPLQFLGLRYNDIIDTVSDKDIKKLPTDKLASKLVDNFVSSFYEDEPYFKAEKFRVYNTGRLVKSAAKV